MTYCTTTRQIRRTLWPLAGGLHWIALTGLLLLPALGLVPDSYGGWVTCPPVAYATAPSRPSHSCWHRWRHFCWRSAWTYARRTGSRVVWQTCLLLLLAGPLPPARWVLLLLGLPLVRWGVDLSAIAWPAWGQSWLGRTLRWGWYRLHQLTVLTFGLVTLYHWLRWAQPALFQRGGPPAYPGLGCPLAWGGVAVEGESPLASGRITEDGTYEVILGSQFVIRYQPVCEFDRRLFLLFLRHIWTVDGSPHRPLLTQEGLAGWFHTHQERFPRWIAYLRAGDWRRLMSRRHRPLLSLEQQLAIVQLWARHIWWTAEEVHAQATAQGLEVTLAQVKEAETLSGLGVLRRALGERSRLRPESLQPKDEWLVRQLFALIETLLSKVEAGQGLTPEEQVDIAALQAVKEALGLPLGRELEKTLPWAYRVEQVLFGWWEEVEDGSIRCPDCGGTRVARKSKKPRYKKCFDPQEQLQQVPVYRYYCKNPACPRKTFTHFPPGLVPYSPWRVDVRVLALQVYGWGRSTYRLAGQAVGVSTATTYRWVRAFGGELLPVAALFGVLRSSGVVGMDEKYVLVPKNDKPAGEMRRWMYVYFAVDVYTYDLLHIAMYPYNTKDSAHAFLLALRAKGYSPKVIVTDLRQDYGPLMAQVFLKARHHECIFHALQNVQEVVKEVYGADYAETHPEAEALKQKIYHIFKARTKRTAQKRYEEVLALRERYVQETPAAVVIFNFLERHWPTLVNGIESHLIPTTNNAVELVIRRFDQHYQNFCGFDTIETAQVYLAVFEKLYRFTPFSADAQPRIRGKCPLELAGYDITRLPMARLCRGQLLGWPSETLVEVVPNA